MAVGVPVVARWYGNGSRLMELVKQTALEDMLREKRKKKEMCGNVSLQCSKNEELGSVREHPWARLARLVG